LAPSGTFSQARNSALAVLTGAAILGAFSACDLPFNLGQPTTRTLEAGAADEGAVDLAAILDKKTTADEVNAAFKEAAAGALKGILEYSTEELVSIDFKGNPHSSIVDSAYTKVMDGDFVKVLSWYDNEWGYSNRCVDLLRLLVKKGL